MSNMKNGFSTLNRWLGKKNKEKATPNGKLSKSSTNLNLSVSSTNINETSQLEYNRITPLPVVTSNAPFEQTFRITVLLPKDQLYVARLGARVPLSKLLELVCENKQLDLQKYEFRNPVDPSQIYSCDLTIGAVGLSEVRLCHKSEAYDNFNADEVIKLHRTSIIRDSLSSSEFSSRNSKHTTKTASPYSSSNSLNSMDSTGMNYTRTPVGPPPTIATNATPKVVMAPPRKKRAAPRPPSQTAIPERSALIITNGNQTPKMEPNDITASESMPTRKDFSVSAPNLASSTMISQSSLSIDCNGNSKLNQNNNDISIPGDEEQQCNGTQLEENNARNLYSGSVHNLSSNLDSFTQKFPEPSPRKRILQIKKKAAPAPPPRGSGYFDDSLSIHSNSPLTPETPEITTTPGVPTTADTDTKFNTSSVQNAIINTVTSAVPEVPATTPDAHELHSTKSSLSHVSPASSPIRQTPQPLARETVSKSLYASAADLRSEITDAEISPIKAESPQTVPKPVPRITTTAIISQDPECKEVTQPNNVSKVMLNRTPTPEPRSLSTEPPLSDINAPITEDNHLLNGNHNNEDDDNISKQADSGIGEPVPSPIPDSLPSESSAIDGKLSTFESSSDDDDMVKVYNFKLGKTLFQPLDEQQVSLDDEHMHSVTKPDTMEHTPSQITMDGSSLVLDSCSWNFQIPISPPPNFADTAKSTKQTAETSDTPITPNIKERPVLDFNKIGTDDVQTAKTNANKTTPLLSHQNSPLNDIVDELSAIISEQRMNTLIKKAEETNEIKAAKPSTLSNFSISTISQQPAKSDEIEPKVCENFINTPSSPESASDEEKLYRKHGSITSSTNILKQRRSVTRADSFHATMQQSSMTSISQKVLDSPDGLNTRSASYLSLTKIDQNAFNLQRRRSSSELSIGESPSLQSLEIIKTILNSRKNSLNNSGSDSDSKSASGELSKRVAPVNLAVVADTKPKSAPEQLCVDIESNAKSAESVEKPAKEIPKVYRYSGPPSINFSTWSERPKVHVAIKNEGDYIFGGTNASNQNAAVTTAAMEISNVQSSRNYRASMPAEDFRDFKLRTQRKPLQNEELKQKLENSEEATNTNEIGVKTVTAFMRLGIPEKEFKVPITVKPLHDVTVESVDLRSAAKTKPSTATTNSIVSTNLNINGICSTSPELTTPVDTNMPRPRPLSQYTNTATLPRSGGNTRFSMPAPGPALLRSTSITQLEANKPNSTTAQLETVQAPFGQNTLRKTGYKEKMLAKEAAEEAKRNSVNQLLGTAAKLKTSTQILQDSTQNAKSTHNFTQSQAHGILLAQTAQKSPLKTLQSAKLELKLQKSTSVYVNQVNSPVIPLAMHAPNSAPVALAPPPPPPSFKGVARKLQLNGNGPSTPTIDPRDQLLEAIRNFKREELNRS